MYILVLNLGLKSIRAIIFDTEGKKIKSSALPVNTFLKGNNVEQDPNEWLEKGLSVIHDVLFDSEIRKKVAYITITSSSSCLVPIDKEGNSSYNCLMVSDKRAKEESEEVIASSWFKNQESPPKCNESMMIPKALWLAKNEPDTYRQTFKLLSPNDFWVNFFTGEVLTDPLNAEKFFYSDDDKSYPKELLTEVGLGEHLLPDVVPIGSCTNSIKAEVANRLKLSDNVKVVISTYDAICAFWGSGADAIGSTCEVSGTVTSLRYLMGEKHSFDSLFTQYSGLEDFYLVGGSNNLGGGLIEWTKQAFFSDEKYPYEAMENEAKKSSVGADGLLFLPYLMGERAPIWNDLARGVFFGLERQHTRIEFVRSVFESTAYSVRTILEVIEDKFNIDRIRVSGGLTRIPLINQIKADILNKEIHVCEEFETTALGALMVSLLSIDKGLNIRDVSKISKVREIIIPNKNNLEVYNSQFELFKNVYQNLIPSFEKRSEIRERSGIQFKERIENL